ncbi:MAG: HAD family hydrolase [Rhodobacteraceae bacterium]|nr:HAD family hydrolase [Paracoccaceae bacterium]
MTPQAIVFDKDGTLFDFRATWEVWARSFLLGITNHDLERAEYVGQQIGFDLKTNSFQHDSIVIANPVVDVAQALVPYLPEFSVNALVDRLNSEAENVPQSEAVALVPFLGTLRARGLKLGVATNDAEGPARIHLTNAGVLEHFDFIAGFDSGYGAKPAPGQLLAFATATNIAPERVVMVGDSTHDLVAGRAAGMQTVGVLTGIALADELIPYADVVLPDIGHLPEWIER